MQKYLDGIYKGKIRSKNKCADFALSLSKFKLEDIYYVSTWNVSFIDIVSEETRVLLSFGG